MGTGAITSHVDVAQLVLYLFWIFFAGLVYYLIRENHRDGYPLDNDRGLHIGGWPTVGDSKGYLLGDGSVAHPYGKVSPQTLNAEPLHRSAGGPIVPTGDPLLAGVGPGSWNDRADIVDRDHHGAPKILPMSRAEGFSVAGRDPDPRGMDVEAGDGEIAGRVTDLWVDSAEMMFRYLEVELPGGRHVLAPMTFARITHGGVRIDALYAAQFANVPGTRNPGEISRLEEEKITAYYGAGTLYAHPSRQEPLV
jgi:photosynthetic reaction center H subunit